MIIFLYEVSGQNRQATVEGKTFDSSWATSARFTDGSRLNYMNREQPAWVSVAVQGEPGYRPELAKLSYGDLPTDTTVIIITGSHGQNAEVRTKDGIVFVNNGGKSRVISKGDNTSMVVGDGSVQFINWPKD